MEIVETFNRHMMVLGRESRGFTQTSLSKAMSVTQGTVSKIESGALPASADFLQELSLTLNYEREFFLEQGRMLGLPPFHYRKRKKLSAKALSKITAEINIKRIHLTHLLRSYEVKTNGFIPEIDRDVYLFKKTNKKKFSVEDAAQQLREFWAIPSGPVDSVMRIIEENGGIIIPCDFGTDLIDAVSQRIDGLPILFFVNMNAPSDRIRMTLSHELAHMVLHTMSFLDDDCMEQEADRFAGAFLLPEKDFKRHLRKFDLKNVANMKRHWKVSMSAIAMRSHQLKLISDYQKKSFFIQMSKLGYRKNEPYEPIKERPDKLAKIFSHHFNILGYSTAQLAKMLFITEPELKDLYSHYWNPSSEPPPSKRGAQPRLRVVK